MTITRIQALIIAAGLALVGVAVARAGNDTAASERVRILDSRSVAQTYPLLDGHLRGDTRTPSSPAASRSISRL